MDWTDDAILLSVTQTARRVLLIEVLTRQYGRCQAIITLGAGDKPVLLPGSFLRLGYRAALSGGSTGDGRLLDIKGGIAATSADDIGLSVVSAIKDMCVVFLPMEMPAFQAHNSAEAVLASLIAGDGRWPLHYSLWELALAEELDLVRGLERCRPAYRHGEVAYVSPRSGRVVTRAEAGAFLDRLLQMPSYVFGSGRASPGEVRQGIAMTGRIFQGALAERADYVRLPDSRERLVQAIEEIGHIPPPPDSGSRTAKDRSSQRRQLSVHPLLVATSSGT